MQKDKRTIIPERVQADAKIGLNDEQVALRNATGLNNVVKNRNSKSYVKIFFDNVCTFYNLLCLACFIALISVHTPETPISSYAFVVIYVLNVAIGIIQEIRAKLTLDKLSFIATPTVTVIRNGQELTVKTSEIVLDDVIKLTVGMQIPTDCVVLSGQADVDESLLTGESVPIEKNVGDNLLSGSFLTSGALVARAEKVGNDCYVQTLAASAKKYKKTNSELLRSMKRIIDAVGALIIPIAIISAIINYRYLSGEYTDFLLMSETVKRTAAIIIGMIPGGMFLLTTLALAVGIIKLAKQNALVQDMYSLETLARVNVLCLDKTGTITDGNLTVVDTIEIEKCDYKSIIANIVRAFDDENNTSKALKKYFESDTALTVTDKLAFSSDKKYSAVTFDNGVTYVLGAPDKITPNLPAEIKEAVTAQTQKGLRVLALGKTEKGIFNKAIDKESVTVLTLIALEDNIRPDAVETIKWFKENDVAVKVISGDDPVTVSRIAAKAGVENAENCVSLSDMSDEEVAAAALEYTVFGRVSPEQKALIIKTLKQNGDCVAMTGDGVNDILAMKQADCSITLSTGNSSTRSLAHLVMMTDNFSCLPHVVKEGRRVINNVQRSSALYLMKTAFTILLAVASIILGKTYPLTTSDILPLELMIIGLPSVVLSVQPNSERVKGKFLSTVLVNALPGTIILLINVIFAQNANIFNVGSPETNKAILVFAITIAGLVFLSGLCFPYDRFRAILVAFIAALIVFWAFVLSAGPLFKLPPLKLPENLNALLFFGILFVADFPVMIGIKVLLQRVFLSAKKTAKAE